MYLQPGKQSGSDTREVRDSDSLSIGVLHLGVKTAALTAAGYRFIKDISDADPDAIARVPLVGWRTVEQLVRNRIALTEATRPDTTLDWATYCSTIGVPLLPSAGVPATGAEFMNTLPFFFEEVACHLSDGTFADILRERICQPPGRQTKLEEIAARVSPPLSRERIRQKEKKLLGQLTGGLLNDSYDGLDIQFHPGFSRWWRIASDALADIDDIEVAAFVELLCDTWEVSHDAVMANLPVILAVVTGEPQMSGSFRSATKIDPKLFGVLSDELLSLPVSRLRLGKHAVTLEAAGLTSFGRVVPQLRSGGLVSIGPTAARHVAAHLDQLAKCIKPDGSMDWAAYRRDMSLADLPAVPICNAEEFVADLCQTVERLLRLHPITKRAPEIFVRRTSQDAGNRMTLQRVADELETHLPTIKREESVMLAWLNDVIIAHDFSSLQVWLDASWLRYWAEASDLYDTAIDYDNFAGNLAWRWRLTGRSIREAAPLLWAVMDGYPDGRRSAYSPPAEIEASAEPMGRIRLRGFRRLH